MRALKASCVPLFNSSEGSFASDPNAYFFIPPEGILFQIIGDDSIATGCFDFEGNPSSEYSVGLFMQDSADLNNDGDDETIKTFQIIPVDSTTGKAHFVKVIVNGVEYRSANFTVCYSDKAAIRWKNSCNNLSGYYDGGHENQLVVDGYYGLPTYEEEVEQVVNGNLEAIDIKRISRKVHHLKCYMHQSSLDIIEHLKYNDDVRVVLAGEALEAVEIAYNVDEEDILKNYILVDIQFKVKGEYLRNEVCCTPLYDENDPEVLDPTLGFPECPPNHEIVINSGLNGPVSVYEAVISGPLAGDPTAVIRWSVEYDNGSTATYESSQVPNLAYGTYTVTVKVGDCFAKKSIVNVDPCKTFDVELSENFGIITANLLNGWDPNDVTFVFFRKEGSSLVNEANGVGLTSHIATQSAIYSIKATSSGGCEVIKAIEVDLTDCGGYMAEISRENGTLTVTHDVPAPYTIQWQRDVEQTTQLMGTEEVQEITAGGLYRALVTKGNCVVKADYFTLYNSSDDTIRLDRHCDDLVVHIERSACDGSEVILTAIAGGGSGEYTYQWDINGQAGGVLGTTNQLAITQGDRVYRVRVMDSSGCEDTAGIFIPLDMCDDCPDLFAPENKWIDKTCDSSGAILPSVNPTEGATIEYSTDEGVSWSTGLPIYDEDAPMVFWSRQFCDAVPEIKGPVSVSQTNPNYLPRVIGLPTLNVDIDGLCNNIGDGTPSKFAAIDLGMEVLGGREECLIEIDIRLYDSDGDTGEWRYQDTIQLQPCDMVLVNELIGGTITGSGGGWASYRLDGYVRITRGGAILQQFHLSNEYQCQ